MRGKIRAVLFSFFLFVSAQLLGQKTFQTVSYFDTDLYAESFSKDDYGHRIISSLALTNAKGLKWVYVKFKGRVLIQTEESSDGHLFAYSKLIDYEISGEDHFREFEIDSLLIPTTISGRLQLSSNGTTIREVPVELLLSGGVIDLQSLELPIDSVSKLFMRIEVDQINYTKDKYENYIRTTRLMNAYYAYSEILRYVVARYSGSGLGSGLKPSELLIGWHELSRVANMTRKYPFITDLNLAQNDPQGFIKSFTRFERLEKRARTLLNKKFEQKPPVTIDDKSAYCDTYVGMSLRYSEQSKKHQPYISSGFLEIVKLQPTKEEINQIEAAAQYYDVFNKLELPTTPQCMYDYFVDAASVSYDESELVLTLDLLYNASALADGFSEIEKSDRYDFIYGKTLDGLLSSYLQVAIMAYRAENFEMADSYYNKALDIYNLNLAKVNNGSSSDAFLNFINQQVDLAYEFMNDEKFREGLKLVASAQSISETNNNHLGQHNLDSAYSIGYLGVYQEKLDSVGGLIEEAKIENAREALEVVAMFSSDKQQYLDDEEKADQLRLYATDLYELYYDRGVRMMNSREPEKALLNFIEAQTINNTYLHENQPALDSMIYQATVPVILELINEAEFATWANKMDEADSLATEARGLQQKYKQEANPELMGAFAILDEKMANQRCVNLKNTCFGLQRKIESRIRNKKFYDAGVYTEEALNLIQEEPECEINDVIFLEFKSKYGPAFNYENERVSAVILSTSGDYNAFIDAYFGLEQQYASNNIKRFGIQKPDLLAMVAQDPSENLVKAAIAGFLKNGEVEKALELLKVAEKEKYNAKAFRGEQEGISNATTDTQVKQQIIDELGGNKWYRYLVKSLSKSR